MSVALYRLARWCYQRRVLVLVVWLVAVAGIVTLALVSGLFDLDRARHGFLARSARLSEEPVTS